MPESLNTTYIVAGLITKLLPLFLYPLGLSIVLSLLALVLVWRGRKSSALATLGIAIVTLWICSTPRFSNWIAGTLERQFPPVSVALTPQADAIVLLGGMTRGLVPGTGVPDLSGNVDRLLHAAALYKAGKAPVLLLTGGNAAGFEPEALSMKKILLALGIPDKAMVLEEASRNTRQNAEYSAAILRAQAVNKILLVTSAYHMRRARIEFARFGFQIVPAATDYQLVEAPATLLDWLPDAAALTGSTRAIREYLGMLAGVVFRA
ncbi:YdcF family protein [Thiolapillus sp.]